MSNRGRGELPTSAQSLDHVEQIAMRQRSCDGRNSPRISCHFCTSQFHHENYGYRSLYQTIYIYISTIFNNLYHMGVSINIPKSSILDWAFPL